MLTQIHPKLPMRDKSATKRYYFNLGFQQLGKEDYDEYLMLQKDKVEIHFFEYKRLNPKENYGQVYVRTNSIEQFYKSLLDKKVEIHPNGKLQAKPWGQMEFSLLDPDNNLLTFGQHIQL